VSRQTQKSFVAALAEKYGQRLKRFITSRARDPQDVPDLAQEVFLRLMRVEQHEGIRSPEAYLFTIASHVVHQHTLREMQAPKTLDITELLSELQLTSADDPSANAELQQRLAIVRKTLEQLPPKYSTALLLHRFAGFTIEEIGEQLGIARVTAKKYLAQALLHCQNARMEE
jgi:RNA polymerase sigma factor (sigma-70 family)